MHENFEPWLFWVTVLGGFTNINSGDIINSGGGSIKKPIEFSHPVDITFGEKDLNRKQQKILDSLPKYGDSVIVKKRDASMIDLAALTAKTGDEFAMFTRKGERMIVRGNSEQIPLSMENILDLRNAGYRWKMNNCFTPLFKFT